MFTRAREAKNRIASYALEVLTIRDMGYGELDDIADDDVNAVFYARKAFYRLVTTHAKMSKIATLRVQLEDCDFLHNRCRN